MVLVLVASVALYCTVVIVDNIGIDTAVVQKHTEHTVQTAVELVLVQEILVWVTMLHME